MPSDPVERMPPILNLQQYYIEQFLLDAIARANTRAPGVIEIRW
jgi:3-(3-hydroxy-phenyl)propionate hydroxylase